MIDDDPFSDFAEPIEEGTATKAATLPFVTRAPAVNSVEIALREVTMLDAILHRDMLFTEDNETEAQPLPVDPEVAALRPAVAADYARHISLARGMGPSGTWKEYREECRRNGMKPICHSDDKGD